MSLVDASTACPSGCTTHGVCDPIGRRCECPLTRTGPACEQLLLPACAVGGQPLHPTYFLHKGWETSEMWRWPCGVDSWPEAMVASPPAPPEPPPPPALKPGEYDGVLGLYGLESAAAVAAYEAVAED